MKVELSRTALRQLDKVFNYIEERSPQGAKRVNAAIWATIQQLGRFPHLGHSTNRPNVRRILVKSYPYAIVYRLTDETVTIQRIRHTSRRPLA